MDLAEEYPPERAARITGVSAEIIEKLARRIGQSESVAFITHMGPTRTYHGHISFRSLATVASVTGNLTVSLRGGHRPAVLNWNPFLNANPGQPSYHRLGILQLYEAVISGRPFPVKALWFSFINFLNQCVIATKSPKKYFPNWSSWWRTVHDSHLPVTVISCCQLAVFSNSDLILSRSLRAVAAKVIEPLYECKSDVDIATALPRDWDWLIISLKGKTVLSI
jgi:anaerobic selenocysteine-containing dehydrogenase